MATAIRLLRDRYFKGSLRQKYWEINSLAAELRRLFKKDNREFRHHVLRDFGRYITSSVRADHSDPLPNIRSAVSWLLRAQQETADDGVSLGYFPCRNESGKWVPSYPETTGYIITTLLAYAGRFNDSDAREAALKMANWEIAIQMQSGAVQGGPVCPPAQQTPAAFNTGMALDGWCSAYSVTNEKKFLDAARRAADFLAEDIDERGYFRTNGKYVSRGEIKTYTCLCAWALSRFGEISGERRYVEAGIRVIESALLQQQSNGWFAHNCLTRSTAPLTHTMGYTLQGVLEVGVMTQRADFIDSARAGVDPLIARIDCHGLLAGRFYSDWEPAVLSSCLTGNAQIAIVCFRLYEITGQVQYREAANLLVNALKGLQVIDSPDSAFNGAIAGSFPLFGQYMRGGYPNWATKYFIDALLLQYQYNE